MTQLQFNNNLLGLQSKLRYYALSLTADNEKANDLLQETLLKALMHRETFSVNTNFNAWIYTIMKNTFINDYRRKVKAKKTFDSADWNSGTDWMKNTISHSPDSIYRSKEIIDKIKGLDDEYRIPFTMFLDGFKYKEIADELNLPLGTVKSRIFFTRKKLEKILQEYSFN